MKELPNESTLLGGMDENLMKRIKVATKLDDKEILQRYKTFNKQFRKGRVSSRAFRKMSLQVLEETEIDEFVSNVFFIFDVGESGYLSFEKFTLATEMANISGNVLDKLSWLFDHVYYYDENMPRTELEKILITLLKMEKINLKDSKELIVRDIFNDLEVTEDNLMNQKDFVSAAKQSELLWTIIDDFEQRKLTEKNQESENNFYPPYAC